ncbi:hypothetical protein BWQ96_07479 [Gracilariopsis chorda]|uniref:Uncharacterized protein n=1 Tax=Gracilariopsis chorda TaxID=448386 RepID=A0A2V3IL12_9FLOR|nr:hypothetical protein BWQ96_07479 [Gracilariopsis chorda]|eukprot:PXF42772.1 hypothetical protein BWQ96_07479 [Gracilariopsis chorda]
MKEFELLARGSAFFVSGPISGALIALLSAHVAAPHRFANYFPHEWLRHVKDGNCRSVLETRSKDGKDVTSTISELPLRTGFRHSALDVAAFVLGEKEEEMIKKSGIRVLKLHDAGPQAGQKVAIGGYRLIGESGSGTEAVIETKLDGAVSEVVQSRVFVNTGNVDSEMGMCGGPVILQDNDTSCCGILEGLVPRIEEGAEVQEMHRRVAGHSVYITARELQMFLHDIETEVARTQNKELTTK